MYVPLALSAALMALAPSALADVASAPESTSSNPAFAPGEQIEWSVEYLGVRTGSARLQVGRAEGDIWPVIAQARTDGIAKLLEIREHFVSYWDAPTQLPRGSHLEALEVGDHHVDRTSYDRDQGKVTVERTRKGRSRTKEVEVPHDVHDFASAIMWLRLQPLAKGDVYEIPVFTGSHTFLMKAQVHGAERVETRLGDQQALRVDVQLGFKDEFKTSRPARIWFSADAVRVPVKLAADFAVGTVVATIKTYVPGGELAARR